LEPGLVLFLKPVDNHARLRQREAQKNANSVQREHTMLARAEGNNEQRSQYRQRDNPIAENEAVTKVRQLARQIAVLGDPGCQSWETGKSGIRRQRQDEQSGKLDVIEQRRVLAKHVARNL